eukprot:scaffold543696_cov38-Prasinocladus_malaysianus.AAC.1
MNSLFVIRADVKVKDVVKDILAGLPSEALPDVYLDALEAAWGRAEEADEAEFEAAAKQVQNLSFRVMQVRPRQREPSDKWTRRKR